MIGDLGKMVYFFDFILIYLLIVVLLNNIFMKQTKKKKIEKIRRSNLIYVILTVLLSFLLSLNEEEFNVIRFITILIEVIMTNILVSHGIRHRMYKLSIVKNRSKYDVKKEMVRVIGFSIIMSLLIIALGTIKQLSIYYVLGLIAILLYIMFISIKNRIKEFSVIKKGMI